MQTGVSKRIKAMEDAEWTRRHAAEDVAIKGLTDAELAGLLGFVRSQERAGKEIELGTARTVASVPWCTPDQLRAAQRYEELYFADYNEGSHATA